MVPDVAASFWHRGKLLDCMLKRSRRHHYCLFRTTSQEEDQVYDRWIQEDDLVAKRQTCLFTAGDLTYTVRLQGWIWSLECAYRLKLNFQADPRLNGCPLFLGEDEDILVGMVISPLGFMGSLECIPMDLIHVESGCFSYTLPRSLILHPVSSTVCCHPDLGKLHGHFRTVDRRAERGQDTEMVSISDSSKNILVSGGYTDTFPHLTYEPFIELGTIAFQRGIFSEKVELVSERETQDMLAEKQDELFVTYSNPVLERIQNTAVPTFTALMEFLSDNVAANGQYTLHWADGCLQTLCVSPEFEDYTKTYGRTLSKHAVIWHEKETVEDIVQDESESLEDSRSCIDDCFIDD